ncbi:putative RNA-binding protein eif1ad [Quaeritorhiza haematococci]|nr:putative RNA-binding protein eif1ad [Quaeritorhiza haematococci]
MGRKRAALKVYEGFHEPTESQRIAQVLQFRGKGLLDVVTPRSSGSPTLEDNATVTPAQQETTSGGSALTETAETQRPQGNGTETETILVALPARFKNLVWLKRGSYVIIDATLNNTKVVGEIVHVLFPDQIKQLKNKGLWPKSFETSAIPKDATSETTAALTKLSLEESIEDSRDTQIDTPAGRSDDDEDEDADLFVNTNRGYVSGEEEEEEEDDSDLFVNTNRGYQESDDDE